MFFLLYSLVCAVSLVTFASSQAPSGASLVPIPSYTGCPPEGPLLPRPTNLTQSKHFQNAVEHLDSVLDSAVTGNIKAGWEVENVSFSLAVVSPNGGPGKSSGKPMWEYHHRGERNTKGTTDVTGDSQYLVGSVSKVFSDLVLLKSWVDIRDPVTKFLPELASKESSIKWANVTLEALAEHLAGIPPNFVYEFAFMQPLFEELGFPVLNQSDYPPCGVSGMNGDCNRQQIIEGILTKEPVAPVNSRPVYSQLSFLVFTLCLEKATGKSYNQLLEEAAIQPLNLGNTGVSPGNSEKAVIPPGTSSWGSGFGYNAPGGGLYSSSNDLSRLLNAILDETILESPAEVRKWLKPTSMTSSPTTLVGKPWEILRNTNLTPENPHTVDIYGKSGGSGGYVSQISIIDEYGVGFVLLTAGPVGSMDILYRTLVGTIIPAVDEEARVQSERYTGNWSTRSTQGTGKDTPISLSLALDNETGLRLNSLTRNGTDMLAGLRAIFKAQFGAFSSYFLDPNFRIYPTGIEKRVPPSDTQSILSSKLESLNFNGDTELIRQDWHIHMGIIPLDTAKMSDLPGQESLDQFCASWQVVDWIYYGGEPMEKIVFVLERETKRIMGVEVPGLRGDLLVRV